MAYVVHETPTPLPPCASRAAAEPHTAPRLPRRRSGAALRAGARGEPRRPPPTPPLAKAPPTGQGGARRVEGRGWRGCWRRRWG